MLAGFLGLAMMGSAATARPYVMERTDVRSMTSSTGAHYRIYIHRPAAPAPESGYPVLYLLDGEDSFPVAAQTAERMARFGRDEGYAGILLVAIGYAPDSMMRRRTFDYTPLSTTDVDAAGRRTGGSDQFRRFLADELKPLIGEDFPVDENRETIWGHSYGGLFVLDTLLRSPALFDSYVATSPAIWFANQAVLEGLEGFAERLDDVGPRVLAITVGQNEQRLPESEANDPRAAARRERMLASRMVDNSREVARRMALFDNLTVRLRVTTGEDHAATPLSGIGEAVQLASGKALP